MTQRSSGTAQARRVAEIREFHLAEYNALRAEILDHSGALITTAQYAVAASAGLYFFLLTLSPAVLAALTLHGSLSMLSFLPTFFMIFGLAINFQKHAQINRIGTYILLLEAKLGDSDLGWEQFLRDPKRRPKRPGSIITGIPSTWIYFWGFMIGASMIGGFIVSIAVKTSAMSLQQSSSAKHQGSAPAGYSCRPS